MKKLMLSIIALMAVTASSVFGMYAADADWVDFLTHGNQLRARVNQFGFVLGNGTIKGTLGFKGNNVIFNSNPDYNKEPIIGSGNSDSWYPNKPDQKFFFNPTVSAGLGYTSEAISAGVGYSFTYNDKYLSTHTPVLMLNFLNNNLRIVVPVSIAMSDNVYGSTESKTKYMGLSTETHIRYYTGLEAFSQLRLYVKYGMNEMKPAEGGEKATASSLGIDFRAYFGANFDNLALTPFIKVTYDTALDAKGKIGGGYGITASSKTFAHKTDNSGNGNARNPYQLQVLPTLGLTASTDIITVYVEPGLGYSVKDDGQKDSKLQHALAWNAYGEITITPLPNLEWYFEVDAGSKTDPSISQTVSFATSTGITWYLPSLQE